MLIEATQPIINHTFNNLKQRIGFMKVFQDLNNDPKMALAINDDLVKQIGDLLVKHPDYSSKIGEDIAQLIFEYLEKHPSFMSIFKSLKPHILEITASEISDIINNLLKDKGPTQ